MGKLAKGLGDDQRSIEYYSEALKLNPFMWDGFVDICHTGNSNFQTAPEEKISSG
jgi:anaphase-promoting complex subunit 3